VPSANCRYGAEEQTADYILASCLLYHPSNGTLVWRLDDYKMDWIKKLHSTSDDTIGLNEKEEKRQCI